MALRAIKIGVVHTNPIIGSNYAKNHASIIHPSNSVVNVVLTQVDHYNGHPTKVVGNIGKQKPLYY